MRQVVQNLRSGELSLVEVPVPRVRRGHVLIQTRASLISAGTERNLVEFAKANLLEKARREPARVRQVLDKLKTDGVTETYDAVTTRLDAPLPLGYCSAGVVLEVGSDVDGVSPGDRVVTNGHHAEVVCTPKNLVCKVPEDVPFAHACFAPVGAIALNGIRLAAPQLGETVCVYGLGLIGLIAVQLLKSTGVRVLGVDVNEQRLALAKQLGAEVVHAGSTDPAEVAASMTQGHGADSVLVAASAKGDDILTRSARMCRQRGKVVLIGAVQPRFDRADFYERELSLQVACSYGPGRYDPNYEQAGADYPYGHVRWTAQRNMDAFVGLLSQGKLSLDTLITQRVEHRRAESAYEMLRTNASALGIVLTYPETASLQAPVVVAKPRGRARTRGDFHEVGIGVVGAGTFPQRTLLPALEKTHARLVGIASAGGLTATHAARRFGFQKAVSDYRALIEDPDVSALFLSTVPDLHADMAVEALEAGKHVFVEKPMALSDSDIDRVVAASREANRLVMVGLNRRYAPHVVRMRELLGPRPGPLALTATINAGRVPRGHWIADREQSGGRIVSECVHWIDMAQSLVQEPVEALETTPLGTSTDDGAVVTLRFVDGSVATIHYVANGHRSFPKERIEVFCKGRVLSLDNFRVLRGFGWPSFKRMLLLKQDKGHAREVQAFVDATQGREDIPSVEHYAQMSRIALAAEKAAQQSGWVPVDWDVEGDD